MCTNINYSVTSAVFQDDLIRLNFNPTYLMQNHTYFRNRKKTGMLKAEIIVS